MALFWKVSLASENEWKITESILILFKKLVTKGFKRQLSNNFNFCAYIEIKLNC